MSNFNFDFEGAADEDFFGTLKSKSSKLQQLFAEDLLPEAEKQQSLKYKRPKANDLKKPDNNEATATSTSRTLMAKVVTAYKQGELQGKVGLALVKTSEDCTNIVMYKSKLNVLVTLSLESDRQALFKQGRYWQFYDESKQYWSFSFEAQQDEVEFQEYLQKEGQTFQEAEEQKPEKREIKDTKEQNKSYKVNELSNGDKLNAIESPISVETFKDKDTEKQSKNTLIKRMAKMGQPLPTLPSSSLQTTTEFSDSSDTEVIKAPQTLPQKPYIVPRSNKLAALKANQQQLVPSAMAYNTVSPVYAATNQLESQYMQMLLTEQRTQGSELRMNIGKLESKMEKVLDKLDFIDRAGPGTSGQQKHKDDVILELEEKILNLKKENRKLKQTIEATTHNDKYDTKSKEILQDFRYDLKEISIEETNDLAIVLKKCIELNKSKENTLQAQQQLIENLKQEQHEMEKRLETHNSNTNAKENQMKQLKDEINEHKNQLNEKDQQLKTQDQQINDLKQELLEKAEQKQQTPSATLVKSIMNNLFADICHQMLSSDCQDKEKVLSIVGQSIKQQTLRALQQENTEEK